MRNAAFTAFTLAMLAASPALAQQDPYAIRLQGQIGNQTRGWTQTNHPNTYEQRETNNAQERQRVWSQAPQTYYHDDQQRFLQQLREQQRAELSAGSGSGAGGGANTYNSQ